MSVREILHKFIRSLLGDEQVTDKWIEENDGHIIDDALSELDKLRLTEDEMISIIDKRIKKDGGWWTGSIAEAILEAERKKR